MTGLSHAEAMRALVEALDEARQARDAARADARILRESERRALERAQRAERERDQAGRERDAALDMRDETLATLLARDEELIDAREERERAIKAAEEAVSRLSATFDPAVRMERRLGDYCPTVVRSPRPATVNPGEGDRTALALLVAELGRDEVRALLYLARRLDMGARQYGALNLETDRRDWRAEAYAEFADGAIYAAFAGLRVTSPDDGGER